MFVLIDRVKLERIISSLEQGGSLSSYSDDIDNNVVSVLRANNSNIFGLDHHDSRTIYFSTTLTKGSCTLTSGYLDVIREKIEHIIDFGITADTISMLSFQRGVNNKVLSNDGDGQSTNDNDRKGYSALIGCKTTDDIMQVLRNGGCDLNTAMNYMAAMNMSVADATRVIFDYSTYANGLPESPKALANWRNKVADAYRDKIDENAAYHEEIMRLGNYSTGAKNASSEIDEDGNSKATAEKMEDGSIKVTWKNYSDKEYTTTINRIEYPEGATDSEKAAIDAVNDAMEDLFLNGNADISTLEVISTYTYDDANVADVDDLKGKSDCSGLVGYFLEKITGEHSLSNTSSSALTGGSAADSVEGLNKYSYSSMKYNMRVGDAVSRYGHTEIVVATYPDGSYDTMNLGTVKGVNKHHFGPNDGWGDWTAVTRYDGIIATES